MTCIYDFLYADSRVAMERIDAAFRKYPEHQPSVLFAVMLKKECGE